MPSLREVLPHYAGSPDCCHINGFIGGRYQDTGLLVAASKHRGGQIIGQCPFAILAIMIGALPEPRPPDQPQSRQANMTDIMLIFAIEQICVNPLIRGQ